MILRENGGLSRWRSGGVAVVEGGRAVEPAKARGPCAKTAARRAQIVRAARDSFTERGYAGASLRDIAERTGITQAGLLHHFRSKDDLLCAVLAQREAEEWEQGVAMAAEGKSNDEITVDLFVSPLTVRTHVHRAMTKLNARDRAQLVVIAYQSGLVQATPPQS
ncbi:TetR family transcriptional regulator [Streptomyces sp. 2A115]|uniref:TetR family transcriptional regulator n=1 Tax=Streptomyces sp. 2A115 TaxID=3457439 RepID=UPI003FCF3A09